MQWQILRFYNLQPPLQIHNIWYYMTIHTDVLVRSRSNPYAQADSTKGDILVPCKPMAKLSLHKWNQNFIGGCLENLTSDFLISCAYKISDALFQWHRISFILSVLGNFFIHHSFNYRNLVSVRGGKEVTKADVCLLQMGLNAGVMLNWILCPLYNLIPKIHLFAYVSSAKWISFNWMFGSLAHKLGI